MKFGVSFSMVVPEQMGLTWAQSVQDLVAMSPELEALGYDSIDVLEHHFQPDGWNPSPLMVLAAVAAVTKRIELKTNILVATLYNPVKLAEDTAVLDNISGGRFTLGVAPGYAVDEFAGMMVPYEGRARRFEEIIDIVQAAWSEDTFSYDGEFFRIPATRLTPKPVRKPHPPIWYGVSGPKMLERAAKRGAIYVGSPRHTITELREHMDTYDAACAAHGFTTTERPIARGTFIAPTRAEAIEVAAPAVEHIFRELYGKLSVQGERALRNDDGSIVDDHTTVDFETFKSRYIIGSVEDAIDSVRELRSELGITELTCWSQLPGVTSEQTLNSARLFAREVIPAFRDENWK